MKVNSKNEIQIGKRYVGDMHPSYIIADVGANHDGDLNRAIKLIHLAKECGSDAIKFQNFEAPKIVSEYGFKNYGSQQAHQSTWKKTVFQVYQEASISKDWTAILKEECDKLEIDYFSSPYDRDSIDHLEPYVDVYKVGSGDITWIEILEYMAKKNKPLLLATGAAGIGDVQRAVDAILPINQSLILMQCNTNYTGSSENFRYLNLRVLNTFKCMYPDLILGFSDHSPGHSAVLGAVALGAKVIEKHFTDDNNRNGPDHPFAMNPKAWVEMVKGVRELELSLGDGNKKIEENEKLSRSVQQRCIRSKRNISEGEIITRDDLEILRPAPNDSILPYDLPLVIGRRCRKPIVAGDYFSFLHI